MSAAFSFGAVQLVKSVLPKKRHRNSSLSSRIHYSRTSPFPHTLICSFPHVRIDKFLWCIRLFKSRSLATEACQKDRIKLNGREVKPSAEVHIGDRVALREPPIWRVFEILQKPSTRMGAKLVPEHAKEVTSWEDLEKQELARKVKADSRDPGTGRPTKLDRRAIERYKGE